MTDSITLTCPDDWHIHLRDGEILNETVASVARQFARAIVMPNLQPPVTHVRDAIDYRARIIAHRPNGSDFQPLMTLYLTNNTTPDLIREASQQGDIHALKLYPAGATTNSNAGVTDLRKIDKTLECMMELDIPLLVHGEVTDPDVDIFDREKVFIDRQLTQLLDRYPKLRVVMEHITTEDAVQFISESRDGVAATITAHHLLYNRNDLLAGGIRPHYYCLPVLKRNRHQRALLAAATSGNNRFFLGTDSAPHSVEKKESDCGCAGCYTAPAAIELYAEAFEDMNALDRLEGFASFFGADFYQLPRNQRHITLVKESWQLPDLVTSGSSRIMPLRAGKTVRWHLQSDH